LTGTVKTDATESGAKAALALVTDALASMRRAQRSRTSKVRQSERQNIDRTARTALATPGAVMYARSMIRPFKSVV